jgi:hypothetical protein
VPGVQEYLPQDHLTPGSPTASRARPHGPNRLVMEGRGVVTRAQAPDQGDCQDGGDGGVVLRGCYEHGVVGAYFLPKFIQYL